MAAGVFTEVFTEVPSPSVSAANGNSTQNPVLSQSKRGAGQAAARHALRISSMPRPQDSILPARNKALAMSGLAGCDGCLAIKRASDPSGGN